VENNSMIQGPSTQIFLIHGDNSDKIESVNSNNLRRNDFSKIFDVGIKNKLNKSDTIKCLHPNCNLTFKNQKLRRLHHDNLNKECLDEDYVLLKTLSKFIKFLKKQTDIKENKIKDDPKFKDMLKKYEEFYKNYKNREILFSILGDYDDLSK
jgi:hypothetical protein